MDGESKHASNVLSTDDIRKQSQNWTLAGDVGLLAHLEQFSEKIYSKTKQTESQFSELVNDYEDSFAKIGNITNQFLALQNCQFVENRVYDEETPTEEKLETKVVDEAEKERLLVAQYKEAIEMGIKLLDTHFHEVELPPNSDSDEEDGTGNLSLIWKPNNPYVDKKFPLIIGSSEWWADDYVGLGDAEEALDTEKILTESESDSEVLHELDKSLQFSSASYKKNENLTSSTASQSNKSTEDLFCFGKSNSYNENIFDDYQRVPDLLKESQNFLTKIEKKSESNTEEEKYTKNETEKKSENEVNQENTQRNIRKLDNAFTKELTCKIDSILQNNNGNIMKNEHIKVPDNKFYSNPKQSDNLFDKSDGNDLFSEKISDLPVDFKSIFSDVEYDDNLFNGSRKLFNESGNNLFNKEELKRVDSPSVINSPVVGKLSDITQEHLTEKTLAQKSNVIGDLFADLDDDDTLFSSKPVIISTKNSFSGINSDTLTEKKPSVLFETKEENNKKSLFDDDLNDLFGDSNTDDSLFEKEKNSVTANNLKSSAEFPQANLAEKAFTSNSSESSKFLTPDLSVEDEKDDLFSGDCNDFLSEKKSEATAKVLHSLNDEENSLLVEKLKQPDAFSISSSRSSLFDDTGSSKSRLASMFEKDQNNKFDDDLFGSSDYSLFVKDSLGTEDESDLFTVQSSKITVKENMTSLFEDFDDTDDLFGYIRQTKGSLEEKNLTSNPNIIPENCEDVNKGKELGSDNNEIFVSGGQKQINKNFLNADNSPNKSKSPFLKDIESAKSEGNKFSEVSIHEVSSISNIKTDKTVSSETKENFQSDSATNKNDSSSHNISEQKPSAIDDDSKLFSNNYVISEFSYNKTECETSSVRSCANTGKKDVGKLNISNNLKNKLESVVKPGFQDVNVEDYSKFVTSSAITEEKDKVDELDKAIEQPFNLLKCASRNRAKIPVHRRPQSRSARQEAIRNSESNFFNSGDEKFVVKNFPPDISENSNAHVKIPQTKDSELKHEKLPVPLFSSSTLLNALSPSTDEEDYFNVPDLDSNYENDDQSIFKTNLFQNQSISKIDNSLLFDEAPILSPVNSKEEMKENEKLDSEFKPFQSNIDKSVAFNFDEDDVYINDKCLFKIDNLKKNKQGSNLFGSDQKTKKPLFDADFDGDDDDDDDDLFGEKLNSSLSKLSTDNNFRSNNVNSQIISNNKSSNSFVDPLGLISENKK